MGVSIMSPISLLLLVPLTVSSLPVSLYSQGESLKDILRLLDRNPTYYEVLRRAGAGAYRCIDDIDDAVDDALDDDIDDAKDAFVVSKVLSFLNKYRTPIINYSKNRFSNSAISSMVIPIMVSDLAQLCRDIGGRHAAVFRPDQTFRGRIPCNINVNQKFLFPFLERKKVLFGHSKFVTLVDANDSDVDHSDFEDSDSDSDFD